MMMEEMMKGDGKGGKGGKGQEKGGKGQGKGGKGQGKGGKGQGEGKGGKGGKFFTKRDKKDKDGDMEDHPCFDSCKDVDHEFCMGGDCDACKGCDKDGCPDECSQKCQDDCGECAMCMMMAEHLIGHPCNMVCGTEEHPGWCYENCM